MTTPLRQSQSWATNRRTAFVAVTAGLVLSGLAHGADVAVHSSGRYYQDSSGKPLFLIGYYAWAPMVPEQGNAANYLNMITNGGPYKINYIRVTCGVNTSGAPNYTGHTPFPYVNGKAVLADKVSLPNTVQWDPVFWNALRDVCQTAKNNGVIVNLCFFDGVNLRGCCEAYMYSNSPWNPGNQDKSYYPAGDYGDCGGCFYRVTDFNNNTGVGYYQRALIDKVISTTENCDNVMFEIGNELGSSDGAWNTAVINYVRSKTGKPIEQCGGGLASNFMGRSEHDCRSVAEVKPTVASIVGHGYPAWQDPDNNDWPNSFGLITCGGNCNAAYSAADTGDRQSAWYAFVGGAACWGGFTEDYWEWPNPPRGFSVTLGTYYHNLQNFISDSGVQFWQMTPQHSLVSNGGSTNSCLTDVGTVAQSAVEYVVYVLSDASVTVDLSGLSGTKNYRLYDPQTNAWGDPQIVNGGAVRTFNKPAGTDDWVIYIGNGGPTQTCSSLEPTSTYTLGAGVTPAVAVDSQDNVHVVYLSGGAVQYKKYSSAMTLRATETITAPNGAYWPHIMCDSNDVPHVVFTEATPDYANYCYYTNRIGGSWKTPIVAVNIAGSGNIWYPRLGLWNGYAYIGCQCGCSGQLGGRIDRLTNLSASPTVDRSVITATRSAIAVNGLGQLFACGRYGAAGTWCQEYDSNLNPVGSLQQIDKGTVGKSGGSTTAWADKNNVVHMVSWAIEAEGPGTCTATCGMTYNNTGRRNGDGSYPNCIQGLLGGPGGTGPDGNEGAGWWNDDVAPVITVDTANTAYVAWRAWTSTGEGRITTVNSSGFTQTCTPVPACGTNACTGTQFTPNITRRRWWNCEVAPASNGGVYVVWDYAGTAYLRPIDVQSTTEVSIDMGAPDTVNGLTHISTGDGHTSATAIGGRNCRVNTNPGAGDYYFYFGVSDAWAFQGSRPDLYIYVDYYDSGTSTISLNYDSIGDIWNNGSGVTLTNTNTWKTKIFHVTDAYFGNRENYGADFRFGDVGPTFYLDTVTVSSQLPVPPIVAAVTPNPQFTYPGIPYSLKPTLTQGYPQPTWSLLQGPAGATVEAPCGLLSGWTPPLGSLGCYTFSIQASNCVGSDVESWVVCVLSRMDFDKDGDVDQGDFGFFQRCLSGTGHPYADGCAAADLGGDGAVDAGDFNLFRPCLAGADQPPGC